MNKFKPHLSVSVKFLLYQLIGLGLIVAVIGLFQYQNVRNGLYAKVEASGQNLMQMMEDILAEQPDLFDPAQLQPVVLRFTTKIPDVHRVSVVDQSLRIIADSDPKLVGQTSNQSNLTESIREGQEERAYYVQNGRRFYRLSRPLKGVYNRQGKSDIIGVLSIDMQVSPTDEQIGRDFAQIMLIIGGVMFIFGVVSYLLIRRSFVRPLLNLTTATKAFGRADFSARASVTTGDELEDLSTAFNQMAIEMSQMVKAEQQARETLQNTVVEYVAFADRVSDGDLSGQLSLEGNDNDPLVRLGNYINSMVDNLRTLIGQVQQGADRVAEASQQLNAVADQANSATQQVAGTIQQVAQGNAQQTLSITDAGTNIDQIARAANGIAQGAQEQAKEVQKTSTVVGEMSTLVGQVGEVASSVIDANVRVTMAARQGVNAVEQTGQGMATIRDRTAVAAEKVKEMNARSKEIGRIAETIDGIADKTDMLALNAAVEAARAGEAGRGFAVVADQVRKLSEDSKESTRDIVTLIERVQETVNEAIQAIENTSTEVDNGTQLSAETAQSLQDILQEAETATEMTERIGQVVGQLKQKNEGVVGTIESVSAVVEENTAAASEMAANSQDATTAMEGVASIAEENSASAEEVSASAEEMSAQVEELAASIEGLSELAGSLRSATTQFRLAEDEANGAVPVDEQMAQVSPSNGSQPPAQAQPLAKPKVVSAVSGQPNGNQRPDLQETQASDLTNNNETPAVENGQ